ATAVAFAPDGRSLAVLTGPWEPRVRLFDLPSGRERDFATGHRGGIVAVAFTADGKHLTAWGPWGAAAWDVSTGQSIGFMKVPGDSRLWGDLARDGQTVATAGKESEI